MVNLSRRKFIKQSMSAGGAALMMSRCMPGPQIIGANERIRIGVIGIRGKGSHHIKLFRKIPGVQVAAICDIDTAILDREEAKFTKRGEKVARYVDARELLDDPSIDAVAIATPNHWHSILGIWACQAGKHVYVEKPVSHNLFEGKKLVEASRKYNRVVQAGTQNRSDPALYDLFDYLKAGNLGEIKLARGLCYKRRKSIGKVSGPQPIPETVDFNLFQGPAPMKPLMRRELHYDWHWQWATGNGDIGNQGIHEMDICRWMLEQQGLPEKVISVGGRFGYDDDGTTANTQFVYFDYKPAPLIFEVRGLPRKAEDDSMGHYRGVRIGVIIHCEEGYFAGGGGGGWVYDRNGKKVKQFSSSGGGGHQANFIKAVRSGKRSDLNADILKGHTSSALCHLGNISYRLGHRSDPETIRKRIQNIPFMEETFSRFTGHLAANNVDITKTKATLGPMLSFNPARESFIEKGRYDSEFWANQLLSRNYRTPFVVPDKV